MLLLGGLAQLNQLVAQQRRLLVSAVFRRRFHLGGEFLQQRVALAVQKIAGVRDRLRIGGAVDIVNAGRVAALNLILQTGTAAAGKIAVLTLAHAEYLGENLQRITRRLHIWIRPEILAILARAAMQRQARERVRTEVDIGITLVIAQQNVVLRQMRLDQIILKNQRLGLAVRNCRINIHHLPHQYPRFAAHAAFAEIARQAAAQILCLADIQHRAVAVAHLIDARQGGDVAEKRLRVEAALIGLAHTPPKSASARRTSSSQSTPGGGASLTTPTATRSPCSKKRNCSSFSASSSGVAANSG